MSYNHPRDALFVNLQCFGTCRSFFLFWFTWGDLLFFADAAQKSTLIMSFSRETAASVILDIRLMSADSCLLLVLAPQQADNRERWTESAQWLSCRMKAKRRRRTIQQAEIRRQNRSARTREQKTKTRVGNKCEERDSEWKSGVLQEELEETRNNRTWERQRKAGVWENCQKKEKE